MAIYELESDDYAAPRARMRVYLDDLETTVQMERHHRNWTPHEQLCPMYVQWDRAIAVLRQLIDTWPDDGCDCEIPAREETDR